MGVSFPSLTSLSDKVFHNSGITSIDDLGKIASIPNGGYQGGTNQGAFSSCVNLTKVVLPETLISIGDYAFHQSTNIAELNIPSSVTTIGASAFYNCTSLAFDELNLPNLTTLGQNAFYGVKIKKLNLGAIPTLPTASSTTQNFGDKSILEEVVISDGLKSIPNYSFYNYVNLKNVSLPSSVKALGEYSFKGCKQLSLDLSKVETFGRECMANTALSGDLSLPSAKGDTGYRAFYNNAITSVSNLGQLVRLNPYTS